MASTEQVKTALLTEHFRYTPLTLLDDIINTVNELVFQAVNAVEEGLLSANHAALGFSSPTASTTNTTTDPDSNTAHPISAAARTEIEAGIVQLESLLNATIDKTFDKLELYTLRNLLTLSNRPEDAGLEHWLTLDHYAGLVPDARALAQGTSGQGQREESGTATTATPTPEALQQLRRKVQETEKLHVALRAEAARNEALLAQLRPLIPLPSSSTSAYTSTAPIQPAVHNAAAEQSQPSTHPSFAFLTAAPGAAALGLGARPASNPGAKTTRPDDLPLALNTQFAMSQLPALRMLLGRLTPFLGGVGAGVESEAALARAAYVARQSARAVSRSGVEGDAGVGAGDAMEIEGSTLSMGTGRRVGGDEVAALEAIVGAIGGASRGGDAMEE